MMEDEAVQIYDGDKKCHFCYQAVTRDVLKSGKLYQLLASTKAELSAHYFCLLFSNQGLQQWGEDREGIQGFREADIRQEVVRGQAIACYRCGRNGATIKCQGDQCTLYYHFSCGATAAPEHVYIFRGEFPSFCWMHAPRQQLQQEEAMSCLICLEDLESWGPGPGRLLTPCCLRALHRDCVQQNATHAGVLAFRCPACNNRKKFCEEMKQHGIYVPHEDSTWESEENFYHFSELEEEFVGKECDAEVCWSNRREKESHAELEMLLQSPVKEPGGSLQEEEVHEEATERRQLTSRGLKRSKSCTIVKFVPDRDVDCHFRDEIPRKIVDTTRVSTEKTDQSFKKMASAVIERSICDDGSKGDEESIANKIILNSVCASVEKGDEVKEKESGDNNKESVEKTSRKKIRGKWAVLSTALAHIPTSVLQDQRSKGSRREGFAIYRRLTCRLCQRTFHKASGLSMHICLSLQPPSSTPASHIMPPHLALPIQKRQLFASPLAPSSGPRPPFPSPSHSPTPPEAAGGPRCNCAGCVLPNCGQCVECLNMERFGETGGRKRRCILRQCGLWRPRWWWEVTVDDLQSNVQ